MTHRNPEDAHPVFFGHFWQSGEICPEHYNAACVDCSAGKGDRLVAFRWRGEERIDPANFVARRVEVP